MTPDDAIRIVGIIGRRLDKDKDGLRDKKAIVTVAALAGPDWAAASALADLLDLDEAQQQAVYDSTRTNRREN